MKNEGYDGTVPTNLLAEYKEQLQSIEARLRNIEDSPTIIRGLLEALLLFYGADRAYVIEFDRDLMAGATTYEICAEGITAHTEEMQFLQAETYPCWAQQLLSNQPVIIPDVEAVKDECPEEYAILRRQNIVSELAVPFSKKFTSGFVGVDNPKRYGNDPSFALIMSYAVVAELNEIKLVEKVNQAARQITNQQAEDLHINCFGGLEIRGTNGTLLGDQITADQCYQLLAYLILRRKRVHPVREIADMLWPNEVLTDPYRDVKNVVYRLKRFLAVAGLEDLVISSTGTFVLNPKYNIYTDFDRFEEIYAKFFSEPCIETKAIVFKTARSLYKGSFLPRIDYLHWVMPFVSYYQGLYLHILKTLVNYELDEKMFPSAQRHAMSGLTIEPYDTDFKVAMVICMYAQNNKSLAENYLSTIQQDITDEQSQKIARYQPQKSP